MNQTTPIRSHTAAVWRQLKPVLAKNEPGRESDTGKVKYGNGFSPWADLPYEMEKDVAGAGHTMHPTPGTPVNGVAATAIINPTGSDNSVLYTANVAGAAGNDITVTYATPAASAETAVAVSDKAITVTPGDRARMIITAVSDVEVDGQELAYQGEGANGKVWATDGITDPTGVAPSGDGVLLYTDSASSCSLFLYESSIITKQWADFTPSAWPDGDALVAGTGAVDDASVNAGISSAAQVIAAVNANTDAAALVLAAASGTVTGAVAAVTATALTGGIDATAAPAGKELFDEDFRYLAITNITTSSTSGWMKSAIAAL
jgi:hypothetical protein